MLFLGAGFLGASSSLSGVSMTGMPRMSWPLVMMAPAPGSACMALTQLGTPPVMEERALMGEPSRRGPDSGSRSLSGACGGGGGGGML